jgi:hypothetical protein
MKRFSLVECHDVDGSWQELVQNENGSLVRYEDHAADIDEWMQINSSSLGRVRKAEDEIEKLRAQRDEARELVKGIAYEAEYLEDKYHIAALVCTVRECVEAEKKWSEEK